MLTPDPSNHEDRGPVIDGQPTVPFDQADLIAYLHGQVEASPVDDGPAPEAESHRYESPKNIYDGEETRRDFMLAPLSGMPGAIPQSGPPRLPPQPDRPSAIPEPETRNLTPSNKASRADILA